MNVHAIWIPIEHYQIQADLYGNFGDQHRDVIIMAHGLGGEKKCGLSIFAEFYVRLGYNVCVFDHRGFGESTGKFKNLVDKNSQISDWKAVIHFLKHNFEIRNKNIILWGYSFSGAHVLTLASEQKFKGIIANFPHVDGLASLTLYPKKYLLPATLIAIQDLCYATVGKIKTMPVVSSNRFAILAGEDCYDGYYSIVPEHAKWDNAVPARIVATIGLYRPTAVVDRIETPTLVLGAEKDSLIPISATRKMVKKIPQGQYYELSCGHFDLFHDPFKSEIIQQHQHFLQTLGASKLHIVT